jgi:hypothetical protein
MVAGAVSLGKILKRDGHELEENTSSKKFLSCLEAEASCQLRMNERESDLTGEKIGKDAIKSPDTIQTVAENDNPARGFRHQKIIEEIILVLQRAGKSPFEQTAGRALGLAQINQFGVCFQSQDCQNIGDSLAFLRGGCNFALSMACFQHSLFHFHAKSGGKDEGLPFSSRPRVVVENTHYVGEFTKVAAFHHSVSFVDHQISDRAEVVKVRGVVLDVFVQTTGCGDDNIRLFFQKSVLLLLENGKTQTGGQ